MLLYSGKKRSNFKYGILRLKLKGKDGVFGGFGFNRKSTSLCPQSW